MHNQGKKRMKKYFIALFIFLSVQSQIFAIGVTSTMRKALDSWIGYNIDDAVEKLGYDVNQKNVNGKNVYTWVYTSGAAYYVGQNPVASRACIISLIVDDTGKITNWQYKGDFCAFNYLAAKKYVNPQNDP